MKKPVVITKPTETVTEEQVQEMAVKESIETAPEPVVDTFSWEKSKPKPIAPKKQTSVFLRVAVMVIGLAILAGGTFTGAKYVNDNFQKFTFINNIFDNVKEKLPPVKIPNLKQGSAAPEKVKLPETAKVLQEKNLYLRLLKSDGRVEVRTGGSIAWRLNNPGRILYGDFAKQYGAIGDFSKYAIFPDYETGRSILYDYLYKSNIYRNLTLKEAMYKYAPKNEAARYLKEAKKKLVVSDSTIMVEIGETKRQELIDKLQDLEGYNIKGVVKLYKDQDEWKAKGY